MERAKEGQVSNHIKYDDTYVFCKRSIVMVEDLCRPPGKSSSVRSVGVVGVANKFLAPDARGGRR